METSTRPAGATPLRATTTRRTIRELSNGPVDPGDSGGENGGSEATPDVDTSGPSSVPIPLLVLGGMSLALLAAGALGYVSRRRQAARELGDHDDPTLG